MILALTLFTALTAQASVTDPTIGQGEPCRLEGERGYAPNGEDMDVYVCKNGAWKFLYKQMPGDAGQD